MEGVYWLEIVHVHWFQDRQFCEPFGGDGGGGGVAAGDAAAGGGQLHAEVVAVEAQVLRDPGFAEECD